MNFFINNSTYQEGIIHTGTFNNIEKIAIKNINDAKEYYFNRVARVRNDNIFVKIINDLYNAEDDIIDFLFKIKARKEFVARNYGIVTNDTKGKIIDDETFNNSREVFISIDNDMSDLLSSNIEDEWKSTESVKCIYHCFRGMVFLNPNNDITLLNNDENVIVYTVDLEKLLLQYRYYYKNALRMDRSTNIAEFVYRYVYPNLINSFTDIAILNSYIDLNIDTVEINGIAININFTDIKVNARLPIVLSNIDSMFNNYSLDLSSKLSKVSSKTYSYLLMNLRLIEKSALDIVLELEKDSLTITSLNRWCTILPKLKYILFSIIIFKENGKKMNTTFLSGLRVLIKMYKRENIYVPDEISDYFFKYLDGLNLIIGGKNE